MSIAEALVGNHFPKPEIKHKVLAVSADDDRRPVWDKSGGVRHRICQTMTLMPTDNAVGVGGHETPDQMDRTQLICATLARVFSH